MKRQINQSDLVRETANYTKHGQESNKAPTLEIGKLAVTGDEQRESAMASIEAERADYIGTAIEDIEDIRLIAIATESLSREFDYKILRVQRALSPPTNQSTDPEDRCFR